jgi:two-component system chemotaxis sensor kinase CheA
MSVDLSQFHDAFFEESFELLESMEQSLLRLGAGEGDGELINTVFRVAHSVKGGAATLGFDIIASLTHSLESLLDALRSQRLAASSAVTELLLKSVDLLREMLRDTRAGKALNAQRIADLQFDVELAVAGATAPAGATAQPARRAAETPNVQGAVRPSAGGQVWCIGFRPSLPLLMHGSDPLRLFAELARLGDLELRADTGALPSLEQLDPESCYLSWSMRLVTDAPRDAVAQVFEWAETDCELSIGPEPPAGAPDPVPAAVRAAAPTPAAVSRTGTDPAVASASGAASESASLRVSTGKIDQLINDVGELVITQSMLVQLVAAVTGAAGDRLRVGLAQLERNVRDLQDAVMRVRMVPVSVVLSRLPRLVRDLAPKLGKRVDLKMTGTETEIDKTLLDMLGDPLVHLVRNAIDHGLETPEARRVAGKADTGTVRIHATQRGGEVVVEVSDDGAGIDAARVLAKARSRRLVSAEATLSDAEVVELIFAPGFSTAEATTEVSGRGVGMDVVRNNIESIGGRVEVSSVAGRGSRFSIHLPLTLAIVDGQMLRLGTETYIIPVPAIVESVRVRPGLVERLVGHGDVMCFRGEYVQLLDLAALLGVRGAAGLAADTGRDLIMVIEAEGRRVGLRIDGLLGQQQVVVRNLESNFCAVDGIAGATILGDGSVALILDAAHFTRRTLLRTAA